MKQKFDFDAILSDWSMWTAKNRRKALLITLAITLILTIGIAILKMEMTFYSIMPQNTRQARDLKIITNEFPLASTIFLVIEGNDPVKLRQAVDALSEELNREEYSDIISQVKGKMDLSSLSDRLLYLSAGQSEKSFLSEKDPLAMITLLNNSIEKMLAKESLNYTEKQRLYSQLKILERILKEIIGITGPETGNEKRNIGRLINVSFFPEPYLINEAQDMALVLVLPAFTMNDITLAPKVERIDHAAEQFEEIYDVQIGATGMIVVGKDEIVTSEQGIVASSLIAFALINILLIINFKMKSVPFMAGLPLLTGIYWTVGLTGFLLGRLNMMTAMYLVALMGLGIDFAIHYMTSFIQERETGKSFLESIAEGVRKSGRGIVLGGLTTAVAFFALIIAESDLVKELAIVAGTGIICELLSMFIILPMLLAFRNSRLEKKGKTDSIIKSNFKLNIWGPLGFVIKKAPLAVFVILLAAGLFLGYFSKDIAIETNIMNMEAKGLESVELQDRMVEKFNMSPDGLNIISSSLDETRELTKKLKNLAIISEVDSVASILPSLSDQKKLKDEYEILSNMLVDNTGVEAMTPEMMVSYSEAMTGLSENLIQLAGKSEYEHSDLFISLISEVIQDSLASLQLENYFRSGIGAWTEDQFAADFISIENLPDDLISAYFDKDKLHNLITIIPRENLWEQENRDKLYNQLKPVTDKATGMIMVADQMTRIAEKDGVRAAIAALMAIFILLLIDFRNLKLTLMSMLPLVAAMFSLFGIMALFNIKFDFVNIISVPLLIGIGIDDSIHLSHRYRLEGPGSIEIVVSRIGRAILMTTLTTMIAFASFIPSIIRAMRSTGIVLTIALALAFIFSIFMHSSLMVLIREKLNLSLEPWGKNN